VAPMSPRVRLGKDVVWCWRHVVAATWNGWTGPKREVPTPKRPRLEPVALP
jgi:hypothetical protein